MLNGAINGNKNNSLMSEYSLLLGEAILRHRARVAEHSARIEADLASKVKSEFIANMSHELRTPLNTVIGFSKILRDHETRPLNNEDIIEYASLINDAAGHLLSVINDILDISKMQSGRYTLDAQEISLEEVLSSCIRAHQQAADQAGVRLQTKIEKDLPIVRGDTTKLTQVFNNLVSNAIKFNRKGGVVEIEASCMKSGGPAVFVRDNGVGMSDEEISVALTPFGQVDGTKARWREGAGLGLPIAMALVELHGGRLEVVSTKSMGTEVAVILPSPQMVSVIHGCDILPVGTAQPTGSMQ